MDHAASIHEADFDLFFDRPQAQCRRHEVASLSLSVARSNATDSINASRDTDMAISLLAMDNNVELNSIARQFFNVVDVERAGAGPGINLGTQPFHAPFRKIDELRPPDSYLRLSQNWSRR